MFQVVELHGDGGLAKTFTVSNLADERFGLSFTQPIAGDRIMLVDYSVMAPVTDGEVQPTRISISDGSRDRAGVIVNNSIDGKVYVRFDDTGEKRCCDLSTTRYRWLPDADSDRGAGGSEG